MTKTHEKLSLADLAYNQLLDKIERLEMKPGQLVTEKELVEDLGIGRMPIREAIKRLEATHLIKIMPRRGMMVTDIKMEEVFLQLEVRRMLEALIAKRAARLATHGEREKFLQLAEDYEEATQKMDMDRSMEIDHEFDVFVAEVARNPFASASLRPLHSLARRLYYYSYTKDEALTKKINDGHCRLMRSIAAGDEEGSISQSDSLMDAIEELYKKNFNLLF